MKNTTYSDNIQHLLLERLVGAIKKKNGLRMQASILYISIKGGMLTL
jgi:hypothetical protein